MPSRKTKRLSRRLWGIALPDALKGAACRKKKEIHRKELALSPTIPLAGGMQVKEIPQKKYAREHDCTKIGEV